MFDPETIKAFADAGLGFIAITVIAFLFYKADKRWNKTIEKLDEKQSARQATTDTVIKDLTDAIRESKSNRML